MVSIVIPTYKRAEYIDRAINSILKQTYTDYEIIVVDDNDPNTIYRKELENKMEKYKNNSKIIYVKHEKNKNGAAARNTGINIAKGEYITFLDDDDFFLPKRLEILTEKLNNNTEYNAAYSATLVIQKGKIIGNIDAKKSGNYKNELLLNKFYFGTGSNMFFRGEALKRIGGFDESFVRHQDIETMIRFFKNNKILAINIPLVVKVQDDRSNEPKYEKYMKIKEHYFETFKDDIKKLENDEGTFYKNQYMMVLRAIIKNKEYKYIKLLKKKIQEYEKITLKDNVKILIYCVNNYIKIENIKYMYYSFKVSRTIDKQVKNDIKEILNIK